MGKSIKIDDEGYDVPTETAIYLSAYLAKAWEKLGKPDDIFSESGKKLLRVIISSYEDLFPEEYKLWRNEIDDYRKREMSIKEQVRKHTGRSLASIPLYINEMIKIFYSNKQDRKFWIKLMKIFPELQVTNKV